MASTADSLPIAVEVAIDAKYHHFSLVSYSRLPSFYNFSSKPSSEELLTLSATNSAGAATHSVILPVDFYQIFIYCYVQNWMTYASCSEPDCPQTL